ncbi:MAG: glycosyltransferase [Pseudomonadota bacterium]
MSAPTPPLTPARDLLMLAPCLPRPDGNAQSLRWFHMLRFLARHYRVHLGCVADPAREGSQFSRVRALCYETSFVGPPGIRQRVRGSGAQADPVLAAWAARLCARQPIAAVLAAGARMGPCLEALPAGPVRVVDFVELESDQRRRHGASRRWPTTVLWRRQARQLLARERAAGAACDHALFATAADVARFRLFAPESAHKARHLASGVDPDYYSPHILHRSPYRPGLRALVFAGAMDERINIEAAQWFVHEVFAPLRAADPGLGFYLVGPRPDARVRGLARVPGVVVTGSVADARPWLAHAALVLAPPGSSHVGALQVLAAMSLQKAVLAAPRTLAGLACHKQPEAYAAADAADFRARIAALLTYADGAAAAQCGLDHPVAVGRAARARVLREHDWQLRLAALPALLGGAPEPAASLG